jgi:ribosomal protein S27AE
MGGGLNAYDKDRPCPKCGFPSLTVEYCPIGTGCSIPAMPYFPATKLHQDSRMHRECPNCGALVDELPLDYSAPDIKDYMGVTDAMRGDGKESPS